MRWALADDPGPQGALFPEDDVVDRHVGIGEFRGLEFLRIHNGDRELIDLTTSSLQELGFRTLEERRPESTSRCTRCASLVACGSGRASST